MKLFLICGQISILYFFYWVGTLIQAFLHISIPGSIIGMLLLFLFLQTNIIKENWLSSGANFLLTYLALLFVPATVGLIDYLPFLKGKGSITIGIVLVSTFLVMVISSVIGHVLVKGKRQKQNERIERGFGA